ncbi:kinase non-catalytic C-lobe domain-containing protein 1 isoform X2 [Triplophysa dalaica]|uniref:kinase non-catalytic C-lobe domain-containing protein 1 isoform X2 n=1 Tax=Triplophysa dalaica TaxID=1582913 RepID=UPI0024E01618|nr:kinase non-catalytic C-lobe domain-containing protein 1 isoform X2 [Triplophysa dalaica]
MGTFGSAALHLQDDGDDEDSDEEKKKKRLPPLLEDEENVSLADILCLRDDGLTEQELWAVCVECVCSLQSISLSPLYHTLCITPDTLAFNAHGNVCFMEQMNDDPDACFIPPEFDKTGNTFEGHVFSLGSSLSSALNYISDVDLELSPESTRLLKQMQMEDPEDRPPLKVSVSQDVMSQAEVVLGNVSPASVCRSLSAIGRRVLSIESVAALQDGWETSGQQFVEHKSSRSNSVENPRADGVMIRNFSSDSCDGEELAVRRRAMISNGSPWSGGSSDSRSQNSSPVHRRSQGRSSGRARRALNRSCSVPDSNNPPAFSPPPHAPISMMMADLSDITEEENAVTGWSDRLHRAALKTASDSEREESEMADHTPEAPDIQQTRQRDAVDEETSEDAERRAGSNHMSRSMTFQKRWMSLRDVLSQSSQPFSVNELWALCHMCLTTLQTYSDLPDDLCLDSVYVTREGEMLFMRSKNTASCDVFFMAPEFQTHGIVTEKACVYGVAAILWTTAKFHLSPNQKLAMPRKLKRLLLEMARKTPVERPSIETVKKCCRDYLARQGTDAEMVWTQLIRRLQQVLVGCRDQTSSPECAENTSDPHLGEDQTGFVSLVSEGRMAPVTGPVPHHNIPLPEAFTSPATHFSPIVLTPNILETDHQSERSVLTERLTDSVTSDSRIENILPEQCEERDVVDGDFSSSSSKTLQNSPASPQASDIQPDLSTLTCVCGICYNFLLQQDPLTGHLTLLPVHIAMLQPITGQESLSGGRLIKKSEEDIKNKSDINRESSVSPERRNVKVHPETQSVSSQRHSCIQQITHLLRHQFIFDGHLENGSEDLAVAEYICSLKNLHYERFCGAVNEKFRDVFWDPELLCVLYRLIHHLGSDLQSSLEAVDRASVSFQCNSSEGCDQRSPRPSSPPSAPEEILQEIKTQLKIKPFGVVHESEPDESMLAIRREDTQEVMSQAPLYDSKEVSVQGSSALMEMQFSTDPEGGAAECVPETEPLWHRSELEEGGGAGLTPDCLQAHMEVDSDSLISDRTLSGSTDPRDPAWALALYGEDSFSPDVLNYAQKLCSHCESPSLEDKSQELQQQLLIESRNLKKTRNFHHKLIHQERRNKGSDTKLMMSKVKLQFDELRDKVHFLLSVKKYLQVLWVDQWGLSLSLLPSLSVCGSSVLQSSDDPAVLSSVCEQRRGKHWPLVTASAAGLMAYLYARKAHIEGFIRQFLYTFRYFCTPEELLEFLMDKYNNTLGATEDQTSDRVKVHQRTVDLLHMWVEDALSVDFSSCLLQTLESFLTSKLLSTVEENVCCPCSRPHPGRGVSVGCGVRATPPSDNQSMRT